jgi:hypothetical protein
VHGAVAKNKAKDNKKKPQTRDTKNSAQSGLSAWVWGLIGAAVGLVGWLAMRFISGMIGG